MGEFAGFFERVTGQSPHRWQLELGDDPMCRDRAVHIPTGFGKTAGVVLTWLFHRVLRGDDAWPRRLVFCLPMRVLVEQSVDAVSTWLARSAPTVRVHTLLGGEPSSAWALEPGNPAVLVGTQDMLLSRALNRGYGSARGRWPMEFGLLNHDCLWVMDEVQLMSVGLATSVQLQAFRRQDDARALRPTATWWMSATLRRDWLQATPEAKVHLPLGNPLAIPEDHRRGPLWDDVAKPREWLTGKVDEKSLAKRVAELHLEGGRGKDGPTLVVVNRVDRAVAVARALEALRELRGTDVRLVHSRFRPRERRRWREQFLNRGACAPGTDRIIVSTQVIEAGVDLSTPLLVTDLAPWASLVQRVGRAARWGGRARIVVVDTAPKDDKAAAPYSKAELDAARDALADCPDLGPQGLEALEATHPAELPRLYPYEPRFVLLRSEIDALFDTAPDLSGDDIDVSRFIRTGEERDLHVSWIDVPDGKGPPSELRPDREALCAVPFLRAREWLKDKGKRAWVWDWVDGRWRRAQPRDFYPGQTVLVDAKAGGYSTKWGWAPDDGERVDVIAEAQASISERSDSAPQDDALSEAPYKTIATHGAEVAARTRSLCATLRVPEPLCRIVDLSSRVHDWGKAHPAFNGAIAAGDRPRRRDLAKAPAHAWKTNRRVPYTMPDGTPRRGLRHELASVLGLFAILRRHEPLHGALLGDAAALFEAAEVELDVPARCADAPTRLEAEVLSLSPDDFDAVAYLVCSHHGKVRVSWHASPADQEEARELRLLGVCEGDSIGAVPLFDSEGELSRISEFTTTLSPGRAGLSSKTGRAWTDRVLGLLELHGPFTLAFLEAIVRAGDQGASALTTPDPLLGAEVSS